MSSLVSNSALYEVRDSPTTGGKALFSKTAINPGTLLLTEESLTPPIPSSSTNDSRYIDNYKSLDSTTQAKYNALSGSSCCGEQQIIAAKNSVSTDFEQHLIAKVNAFEGGLIFPTGSYFNHSCDCNVVFSLDGPTKGCWRAVSNIKPGEELTISYLGVDVFAGSKRRRERLQVSECSK